MKKLLAIFLLFLLLKTTSASILIDKNPMNISVKINEKQSFSIDIMNNHNFEIFDFGFEDLDNYGFSFSDVSIPSNESKTINFDVQTATSKHEQLQKKVSFKYFVDLPEEVSTYYINITPMGFSPDFLVVRKGDTIVWKNLDDISHTITYSNFDEQLFPNQTFSRVFDTIETINYQDLVMYFPGTINVINRSSQEKAHNPNNDIIWNIEFNSILNPTTLSADISKKNFDIEYQKFKKGLLTISNNGSELAELVHLSSNSDWITFSKNNFNIPSGEEEWVEYIITPILFNTNETNKNYTLSFNAKASNSNEITKNLNIFVPFSEVNNDFGGSNIDTLNWLENVFCPQFPSSFLCNQSISQGNGSVIYRDTEIPINISMISWYEQKKDIQTIKDSISRTDNEMKILMDLLGVSLPEIEKKSNESYEFQLENQKKITSQKNVIWIIGFFVLIVVGIWYIFNLMEKQSGKEIMLEGQYKYRQ